MTMENWNIFPARLKSARLMRGMSLQGLSGAMGEAVSKQTLSKYERGQSRPDSTMLIALCRALGVRPDYFFKRQTVALGGIHYRKLSKLKEGERKSVEIKVRDTVENLREIEDITCEDGETRKVFHIHVETDTDAAEAADTVRERWKLGSDPIGSVSDTLEANGCVVVEVDAPSAFSGLNASMDDGTPVIVVNANANAERFRFTELHELGHAVLEFGEGVTDKEQERLCNVFANEMLIPRDVFVGIIGRKRHDIAAIELRNVQSLYGISIDALMYKAKCLGVISEERYRTFCKKKNYNPKLREYVEREVFPREHSKRLESLVYRALSTGVITSSRAAALLGVPVHDVLGKYVLA